MKESIIQKGIMDYLAAVAARPGSYLYWFRAGAGCVKTQGGNYFKTGKPGVPDLVAVYNGEFVGLEVKTAKGRQSAHQKEAEEDIKAAGGHYYIVRSISDVKKIIPFA